LRDSAGFTPDFAPGRAAPQRYQPPNPDLPGSSGASADRLDACEISRRDEPAHAGSGHADETHPLDERGMDLSDSGGELYEVIASPRR
jgi:hypothetical protein